VALSRVEHESAEALRRGKTAAEMRRLGYFSALCLDGDERGEIGWQTFALPPDQGAAERAEALKFWAGLHPKPYGEAG
jgi:hypothetical protein